MDYRNAQAAPSKHLTGIAVVVGVHLFVAWLVVSGVGGRIIRDVIPPPIVITPIAPEKEPLPEPRTIEEQAAPKIAGPVFPIIPIDVMAPDVPVKRSADRPDTGLPHDGKVGIESAAPLGNGDAVGGSKVGSITTAIGVACPNSQSVREICSIRCKHSVLVCRGK